MGAPDIAACLHQHPPQAHLQFQHNTGVREFSPVGGRGVAPAQPCMVLMGNPARSLISSDGPVLHRCPAAGIQLSGFSPIPLPEGT